MQLGLLWGKPCSWLWSLAIGSWERTSAMAPPSREEFAALHKRLQPQARRRALKRKDIAKAVDRARSRS